MTTENPLVSCQLEERLRTPWVEEWRGVEDFEQHLRGAAFRRILAVIELADRPPVVEIDDVTSRRGFELVEEILGLTSAERAEHETG